jgi:hypothetical protein
MKIWKNSLEKIKTKIKDLSYDNPRVPESLKYLRKDNAIGWKYNDLVEWKNAAPDQLWEMGKVLEKFLVAYYSMNSASSSELCHSVIDTEVYIDQYEEQMVFMGDRVLSFFNKRLEDLSANHVTLESAFRSQEVDFDEQLFANLLAAIHRDLISMRGQLLDRALLCSVLESPSDLIE